MSDSKIGYSVVISVGILYGKLEVYPLVGKSLGADGGSEIDSSNDRSYG